MFGGKQVYFFYFFFFPKHGCLHRRLKKQQDTKIRNKTWREIQIKHLFRFIFIYSAKHGFKRSHKYK